MNKLFVLLALCASSLGQAEDLGIKGQTYATDKDGREQLKDVIRQKQQSGEVDRFWKDYQAKTIEAIKHPAPLGIASNYAPRIELRDLRFAFSSDMKDERGRVVVKAGTVVEPLKVSPLTTGLIFIDGRDQAQVDYAIKRGRAEPLKIVLTAGSPFDLRVKYKNAEWWGTKTIPFYFDQKKMIINNFKRLYGIDINSVPAVLTQKGTQLSIEFGVKP